MLSRALFALASALAYANASFNFVTLNADVKGNAWITEAKATLTLPEVPEQVTGDIQIWSGIMMESNATMLKGVSSNSPNGSLCNDNGEDWCNFAQVVRPQLNSNSTHSKAVVATPGSTVKIHQFLDPWTTTWKQKVYVNNHLRAETTFVHNQKGETFFVSADCASGNGTCGEIPAHKWDNVFIGLNQADESFAQQGPWAHGANGGNMTTRDGGMTWSMSTLNVPALSA